MALLEEYHRTQKLIFSGSCSHLRNSYTWKEFKNKKLTADVLDELNYQFFRRLQKEGSVSYTHLDVYKRQTYGLAFF